MDGDDITTRLNRMRHGLVPLTVGLVLGGLTGCTLDFDQFQTRDVSRSMPSPLDAGDTSSPPSDSATERDASRDDEMADIRDVRSDSETDAISDVGPDGDGEVEPGDVRPDVEPDTSRDVSDASPNMDAPPDVPPVGTVCQSDSDCEGAATCFESYCTTSCEADADCPGGSSCRSIDETQRCLLDCSRLERCSTPGLSRDLSCARLGGDVEVGTGKATLRRACLPDTDGDGVFDGTDNCPDTANATQSDRDSDSRGDACDPSPTCHASISSGRLDYGTQTYQPEHFSVPPVVESSWLPVVGGLDGNDAPTTRYVILDRSDESWVGSSRPLPYPAVEHALAPLGPSGGYVSTSGAASPTGDHTGRLLSVREHDPPRPSLGFRPNLSTPVLETLPDGSLVALGFSGTSQQSTRRLLAYDPQDGSIQTIDRTQPDTRARWDVVRNEREDIYFYQRPPEGQSDISFTGTVFVIRAQGLDVDEYEVSYPDGSGGRPFDPVLLPGLGQDRLHAFNRESGEAAVVDLNETAPIQATAVSDWDLSWPFEVEDVAVDPYAPSLIAFGRDADDSTNIRAVELSPTCHPAFQQRDVDGDREPDVTDNCPTEANADQQDADRDGLGDACDPDDDNDGIPDGQDFEMQRSRKLDTDNDGKDNLSDPDIDGDGIPNTRDRFIFDSDNDSTPNLIDTDDDDDGYTDAEERGAGTNATRSTDFPGAGYVTFVRRTSGTAERSAEVGPLARAGSSSEIILNRHVPHDPLFYGDKRGVVALSGTPGNTSTIVWNGAPRFSASTRDLNAQLRAVAPLEIDNSGDLTTVTVIKAREGNQSTWELASRSLSQNAFQTITNAFGDLRQLTVGPGNRIAFLGAPSSCLPCRSVYDIRFDRGNVQLRVAPDHIPVDIGFDGARFVATAAPISGGMLDTPRTIVQTDGQGRRLESVPTGRFEAVNSAVPLASDGHILASARERGRDSFNLWLYNNLKDRWDRVYASADDLIEIDWTQ